MPVERSAAATSDVRTVGMLCAIPGERSADIRREALRSLEESLPGAVL